MKIEYVNNRIITLDNAKVIVEKRIEIMENKNHKLLLLIPQKIKMNKEVRDYLAGPYGIKNILANAIVVQSKYSLFIINFFVKVMPPPCPTKIFTTEEKAIEWLKKL